MRVAIYVRYSSDLQSEASIEDQVEICKRLAKAQGWQVVDIYSDRATSGASTLNRSGYRQLEQRLSNKSFDMVLCEGLDRLARRLSDVSALYDQLAFNGIRLHTVQAGEITQLHIGLLGTMSELFLSDLKAKTKRGQLGKALQGKIPGGKAYGYDMSTDAGERTINPREADIIRRIFRDYASGISPRSLARTLNTEAVPGPDGRPWRDTTIRGQVDRGTGLLNNALYVGRLEWNRCSYVKDPVTGKRVARINPKDNWEVVEVSHLQIVGNDFWQSVKERQASNRTLMARDATGNALNRVHRKKFLFSGLLTCGCCQGAYTIMGKDRYGCSNRNRGKATCSNGKTIKRQALEARVLKGLKSNLVSPELISVFVEEYAKEINRLNATSRTELEALEANLAATGSKINSIIKAIEDGLYSPAMKTRLQDLEHQHLELVARIDALSHAAPAFTPHPNLHEAYLRQVQRLEETLNEPSIQADAIDLIQSLVTKIILAPDPANAQLSITIQGDLARILSVCAEVGGTNKNSPDFGKSGLMSVVAGAGFEPATFRL
ncbi:recombinase family protein [Roseibium sp. ROS1]